MQSFEPAMFFAVIYEMLGLLLWFIVVGSAVATAVFVWLMVRDRGLVSRRFVVSEVVGVAGGVAAVMFMQVITRSGLVHVGGPVDWLLIVAIWLLGAVGTTVVVYDCWGVSVGRRAACVQPG